MLLRGKPSARLRAALLAMTLLAPLAPIGAFAAAGSLAEVWVDGLQVPSPETPPDGSAQHPYPSIAEGLAVVADGGTVFVRPAVYAETVELTGGRALQGTARNGEPVHGLDWGGLLRGSVTIDGDGGSVSGLAFTVPDPAPAPDYSSVYVKRGADAVISSNLIDPGQVPPVWSRGILTLYGAGFGPIDITVQDNVIRNVHLGVYLNAGAGALIVGNTISGTVSAAIGVDQGLEVDVVGNTIRDNLDKGVWLGGVGAGSSVRRNAFSGNVGTALAVTEGGLATAPQNWWGSDDGPQYDERAVPQPDPDPPVSQDDADIEGAPDAAGEEAGEESDRAAGVVERQLVTSGVDVQPWCRDASCDPVPVLVTGIVSAGGVPIPGATIVLEWDGGEIATAAADGMGRIDDEVVVPPSVTEVTARAVYGDQTSEPVTLAVGEDPKQEELSFTLTERDESATDPAQSTISSDRAEAAAGGEPAVITLIARNADGERRTVGGDAVAMFTTFGALSPVQDNGDGSYTADLSSDDLGDAEVYGEVNGGELAEPAEVKFVVGPASAATTSISAAPPEIPADGASHSTVRVQLKAAGGSDITTNGDEVVTLELTPGSVGTLSAPVEGVDGTWTAVLVSSTTSGTSIIVGTLDAGAGAQPLNSVAIVEHHALAGDPRTSTMHAPSAAVIGDAVLVSVQVKDRHGNNGRAGADTVTLTATGDGEFSPGVKTATGTTNADGVFEALLTADTAGASDVSATVNQVPMLAKATVTFSDPPAGLSGDLTTLTPSRANVPANGTATSIITVQAKDADGVNWAGEPVSVSLSTDRGFFVVDGASVGAQVNLTTGASGRVTVELASSVSGLANVGGFVGGLPIGGVTSVTFRPLSDATTTIAVSDADRDAGETVTVTVTPRSGGAAAGWAGERITLTTDHGTFPNGLSTISGVSTLSGGIARFQTTLTAGDPVLATINGTIEGQPITQAPTVTFHSPLDGALSTIRSDESAVVFGGERVAVVTVRLRGEDGEPRRHPADAVTVMKSDGVDITNESRSTQDPSVFTFHVSSRLPWPDGTRVRAQVGSTFVGTPPNDGVTIVFEPPSDASKSTIERTGGTGQLRAGIDKATIRVTTKNILGEARGGGGDAIVPTATPADGIDFGDVVDHHDGTYEFTVSATGSANVDIGARVEGEAISEEVPLQFRSLAAGATSTIVKTSAGAIDAGSATTTLTVTINDDAGRARTIGDDEVTLSTVGGGSVSPATHTTTQGSNTFTATFTAPEEAGTVEVHGTVNGGEVMTPLLLTVRGAAATAADSTMTASPTTVPADQASHSLIAVQLRDTYGNPSHTACTASNLSFLASSGGFLFDRAASGSVCTVKLRSATTDGAVVTVRARYNGTTIGNSEIVTFEAASDPGTTTIEASEGSLPADGASTAGITVQTRTASGAPRTLDGDVVGLTTTAGTLSAVSDNGDGTYTAVLTAPTEVGTATIEGTLNGEDILDTAVVKIEATQPTAPQDLQVAEGDQNATVSWEPPASDGGEDVTGYVVYQDGEQVGTATTAPAPGGRWSFNATGLTNGEDYEFGVAAINAVGHSPIATRTASPFGAPAVPAGVTAVRDSGKITLTWDPVDGNGRDVTGYIVYLDPAAEHPEGVDVGATPDDDGKVRHTFTDLTKGTSYDFTVVAENGKTSNASAKEAVRFAFVPGTVSGVSASPGDKQVTLRWTAPQDNGGETVTSYVVTVNGSPVTPEPTGTSVVVTGLANGVSHSFTVAAVNGIGAGTASSPISATPVAPSDGGGLPPGSDRTVTPTPTSSASPSPSPSPTSAPAPLPGPGPVRINGEDRASTAAAVSASHFDPGVSVVYVATAANFADALAGGPAAAHGGGPVLLVDRDRVPESTSFELQRLDPARVVVLGGTGAVSELVAEQLDDVAPVQRVSGNDRFSTAAAVSAATFPERVPVAYIATGTGFADALSGGAAAARDRGPVLLAGDGELPAATLAELRRLSPRQIVVLGGTGAVSPEVAAELAGYTDGAVERLSGSDRYATSAAIAARMFPVAVDTVFVATGQNFPDALAGVPAAAREKAPLLLVRHDAVPDVVAAQLERLRPRRIVILGGNGAVSAETEDQLSRYTVE